MKGVILTTLMLVAFQYDIIAQNKTGLITGYDENPQQKLQEADRFFDEGMTFKSLNIYRRNKGLLNADQKKRLAICLVEKEEFQNAEALDILKEAWKQGHTEVAP